MKWKLQGRAVAQVEPMRGRCSGLVLWGWEWMYVVSKSALGWMQQVRVRVRSQISSRGLFEPRREVGTRVSRLAEQVFCAIQRPVRPVKLV